MIGTLRRGPIARLLTTPGCVLAFALAAAAMAREPAQTIAPRTAAGGFTAADVFALRSAADVQVSPDGRIVAYTRATADILSDRRRRSIWLVDVVTKRERLLASGATTPRWSPDGRSIAFVVDRPTGGAEIRLSPHEGASARVVATLPGTPAGLTWSPDGRELAFTRFIDRPSASYVPPVAKPAGATWAASPRIIREFVYQADGQRYGAIGETRLFTVAIGGGIPRELTAKGWNVASDPVWVRGGAALVFAGAQGEEGASTYFATRLYRVAATGGPLVALTPDRLAVNDLAVSPDGRSVVFVGRRADGHDYEQGSLYLVSADGGDARALAPTVDREIQHPVFSGDGSSVFASYGDAGHQVLARLPRSGPPIVLVHDVGDDGAFSVARNGTLGFASVSATRPAEAAVMVAGGEEQHLTALNERLLAGKRLGDVRALAFRSADGVTVGAWLTMPPAAAPGGRLPLVLDIHGGPHGCDDPGWRTEDQLLAAAGYAVLHVNYRGSLCYGFAFADAIARDFPGAAYDDLMAGVDAAVATGFVDPGRLFVTGGSAGGELTAIVVGRTQRFRAALAEKPVINLLSESLTTERFGYAKSGYGSYPWEDPMTYWKRSPLSLVGNVATPTMLVVGEQDHNTPPSEAEQFYAALKLRGVPTELVIVPDAGHDTIEGTPSRQIAFVSIMLDWFGRYGGAPAPRAVTPP